MERFKLGDEVRNNILDKDGPDFERLHGYHGAVIGVLDDGSGLETGDAQDSAWYRIELGVGEEIVDLQWRDLRPL